MGIDTKGTRYFDRYVFVAQRSTTARGALWEAYDAMRNEDVAIEVIGPPEALRADAWVQLQREHSVSERIAHANVLAVHEPRRADGVLMRIMQFAANGRLSATPELPQAALLPILIDVAEALRHAHASGIAHLDLSARAVFLDAGHCALVSGFQYAGGTPAEFDAAVRKDLRDFAALTSQLLEGSEASRRELPPRLRAMCDAIHESTFTSRPVTFATIAEELELALHDTAPLASPHDAAQRPAEQPDRAVNLATLALQPAPSTELVAVVAREPASLAPLAATEEPAVRDSRPVPRRLPRVRREALAWRWLAGVVAIAIVGSAWYLGQRNAARVGDAAMPMPQASDSVRAPVAAPATAVARAATLVESGIAALNEFDGVAARHAFTAALKLDPQNAAARRGLLRSERLAAVQKLVSEARRDEVAGEIFTAAQRYSQAAVLDPEHAVPSMALARLRRAVGAEPQRRQRLEAHVLSGAGQGVATNRELQSIASRPSAESHTQDGRVLATSRQ